MKTGCLSKLCASALARLRKHELWIIPIIVSLFLNGVMAVSEVTYGQWIKFYVSLVGIYMVVGMFLTLFASIIVY